MDIIKDTDEHSDEEIDKGEVREDPECRNFPLCGAGVHHPPCITVFIDLEALQIPFFGVLINALLHKHDCHW